MHEDNGKRFYYNDKIEKVYGERPIVKNKLGLEPAFATSASLSSFEAIFQEGMCAAMQGILANRGVYYQSNSRNDPSENLGGELPEYCIKTAYIFADELLKQENG